MTEQPISRTRPFRASWFAPSAVAAALLVEMITFYLLARLNWPVPFDNDSLKEALPQRYLISTSLRDGLLPLWNQYSGAGFGMVSLYRPMALSPIVWALSAMGPYTISTLVVEVMIYNALAFLGMFLWIRSWNTRTVAVLMATVFALTPFMAFQARLNTEGLASAVVIPWLCLGGRLLLQGRWSAVPVLAATLGIAFTTGYLGANVLYLEFLIAGAVAFLVVRWAMQYRPLKLTRTDAGHFLWSRARLAVLVTVIVLAITAYAILESAIGLGSDYFLGRSINPYLGSARLDSLLTVFDTAGVDPFSPDPNLGQTSVLFVGSLAILALLWGAAKPTLGYVICVALAGFTFVCSLSDKYPIARIVVDIVPGMAAIRFHSWLIILCLFFLLTAASWGLRDLLAQAGGQRTRLFVLAAAVGLLGAVSMRLIVPFWTSLSFAIVGILIPPMLVAALIVVRSRWGNGRAGNVAVACLLLLTVGQIAVASVRTVDPWATNRQMAERIALAALITDVSDPGFPVPGASRGLEDPFPPDNSQFFSKKPVVVSYAPQRSPAATRMIEDGRAAQLAPFFTAIRPDGQVIQLPVTFTAFDMQRMHVAMNVPADVDEVVWNSPFSANWRIQDSGRSISYEPTPNGMTRLSLGPGQHVLAFEYAPTYLYPTLILSVLGWGLILAFAIVLTARRVLACGRVGAAKNR